MRCSGAVSNNSEVTSGWETPSPMPMLKVSAMSGAAEAVSGINANPHAAIRKAMPSSRHGGRRCARNGIMMRTAKVPTENAPSTMPMVVADRPMEWP